MEIGGSETEIPEYRPSFYRWDAPAQNYRTVSPDYNDIKIIDGGNAQF